MDEEVSKLLFPGVFNLTPAEKSIQKLGNEFLKRAGIHTIMANIKASDQVKAKTKDKIKKDRCDRFIPMCVSAPGKPATGDDMVALYGLKRKEGDTQNDQALIDQLQSEAQAVSRACYLHGYRSAVTSMQPYLNNAGEWYTTLAQSLTDEIFLQDWQNKTSASEGSAKKLYDIHTKLDVLWQAVHEKPEFEAKLPPAIAPPTEVIAGLNAASLAAALDQTEFDDTARQNLIQVSLPFLGYAPTALIGCSFSASSTTWRRMSVRRGLRRTSAAR